MANELKISAGDMGELAGIARALTAVMRRSAGKMLASGFSDTPSAEDISDFSALASQAGRLVRIMTDERNSAENASAGIHDTAFPLERLPNDLTVWQSHAGKGVRIAGTYSRADEALAAARKSAAACRAVASIEYKGESWILVNRKGVPMWRITGPKPEIFRDLNISAEESAP